VRRVLILCGILMALTGMLVCWPLAQVFLTHEAGHARILEIYRDAQADGRIRLRAVWELRTGDGQWLIGDAQSSRFFRRIDDPVVEVEEAADVIGRLMPDRHGVAHGVKAFWKANDPAGTAFIIDITQTHPWRRYIAGLAACGLGLIIARLAWANGRWRLL